MLVHPQFNPIAIDLSKIGVPIAIHWYGITYLVAFALFLWLASLRVRQPWYAERGWNRREIEDMLFAIRERDVRWVRRLLARWPALAAAKDAQGKAVPQHATESGDDEIARLFGDRSD